MLMADTWRARCKPPWEGCLAACTRLGAAARLALLLMEWRGAMQAGGEVREGEDTEVGREEKEEKLDAVGVPGARA